MSAWSESIRFGKCAMSRAASSAELVYLAGHSCPMNESCPAFEANEHVATAPHQWCTYLSPEGSCMYHVYDMDEDGTKDWAYFCQISDSTTSYGSYSGATPNEKITWDKLTDKTPMFVIESDATIVVPLILQALIEMKKNPKDANIMLADFEVERIELVYPINFFFFVKTLSGFAS